MHQYVPAQFHDPFGLFIRLIRTRDTAAYHAMVIALLGIVALPLDRLFEIFEKRHYQRATAPEQPLILVCGAPRTGTTLTSQVLIHNLPVCYFNNLTAIFPKSPIIANKAFGRLLGQPRISYKSYYGKSAGLSGPNDALYIWDRWFGKDRTIIPTSLSSQSQQDMLRFFGAYEAFCQKPLVNKNNNMNTYAHLVAAALDNVYFICLTRDPLYLAQSLLRARLEIHGNVEEAYGIGEPIDGGNTPDYIEDVCRQVLFHERAIAEQQRLIGSDRFWIIQYEEFCKAPEQLVTQVYEKILGQSAPTEKLAKQLPPFEVSNRIRVDPEIFEDLKQALARMQNEMRSHE